MKPWIIVALYVLAVVLITAGVVVVAGPGFALLVAGGQVGLIAWTLDA